jgi:putative transcriptional regulator
LRALVAFWARLAGALVALACLAAPVRAAEGGAEPGAGRFLVAKRAMGDPRFARTVILLVDYGPEGALGIIVNRPTVIPLTHAFPDRTPPGAEGAVLWFGGPVAVNSASVLIDAAEAPPGARHVFSSVYFGTSRVLLDSVLAPQSGSRFRIYSGYAGWGPSQLDAELARGDWTVTGAGVAQVFAADGEALWRRLVGADGTWVNGPAPRGAQKASGVLAADLEPVQRPVRADPDAHPHGLAAHGAVLHVVRVASGAVHAELQRLPAVRAGDGGRVEHLR